MTTVASADIGASNLRTAIVDIDTLTVSGRSELDIANDPSRTAEALLVAIRKLGPPPRRIGIAAAPEFGENGLVRRWPNRPNYVGFDLLGPLRRAGYDVAVLDDGMAGAVAAARQGGWSGLCVHIVIGTGIGGGVVLAGQPVVGARGRAMDIGHLAVPAATGVPCGCGRTGCLQAVASGRALAARAADAGLPLDGLDALAASGDPNAAAIVETQLEALAQAIEQVTTLLDPDKITLGAGYARYAAVATALRLRLPGDIGARLFLDALGDNGPLIGAALYAASGE
ncbi:MAG TPA: ROK family protein [Rhizomicrobium sp.]|nr:ROK family protein [Rhizomicrobium sp.]